MSDEEVATGVRETLTVARWSRAIFSTYSISLSFFEAFLLPMLEDVGCGDISILVDEAFYLRSLSERQAVLLGKSYRLYPVSLRGTGIFHPKLTYLCGPEFDLLAVGSGNLTYAGHGANLECVDFALSTREPALFFDFAEFLSALLKRPDADLGESRDLVARLQSRALAKAGAPPPDADRPRLLHSVQESIGAQLRRSLKPKGPLRRLVCASPFHHPKGDSLARLAVDLGIKRVDVCLDPSGWRAPFEKEALRASGLQVRFVAPEDHKDTRPLHAKWYEFHGQSTSVFTGSVNATDASLWSTNNIEVGILRPLTSRGRANWVGCEPERIESAEFVRGEPLYAGSVTALLQQDGTLEGRLRGAKNPEGKWSACLISMLGRASIGSIEVGKAGEFRVSIADNLHEEDHSLQLELARDKEAVAGWVAIKAYLEESVETRGARFALGRLSRGEGLEGDVARIVYWLTSFVEGGSDRLTALRNPERPGPRETETVRRLTYDEWLSGSADPKNPIFSLSHLFRRALETLAGGKEGIASKPLPMESLDPNLEEGSGNEGGRSVQAEEFDVISELIKLINRVLAARPALPIGPDLALFKADRAVRSAMGPELAQVLPSRGMEWIGWVSSIAFPQAQRQALLPVVVAMAACVVAMASATHAAAWTAELRETLRKWLREDWSFDNLRALTKKGMEHRLFSVLTPEKRAALTGAVKEIWNAKTILEELEVFLAEFSAKRRPIASPSLEQTLGHSVVKALLERARDAKCQFGEVADPRTVDHCPCPGCWQHLTEDERRELRRRRGIKCRGCGRAILWLGL